MEAGVAEIVTVGAAGGGGGGSVAFTVTVALAVALPPGPVTAIVYVVVCAGDTLWVPLVCTVPMLLSICADAAFVELHVRVELWPAVTDAGLAVSVTVGAGVVEGEVVCAGSARRPPQLQIANTAQTRLAKASVCFAGTRERCETMPKYTTVKRLSFRPELPVLSEEKSSGMKRMLPQSESWKLTCASYGLLIYD
jgi:hypothetical protein